MDPSERVAVLLALQMELDIEREQSLDLLVSAFAASLKSHRRGSVCRPFPGHLQPGQDYEAMATALDAIPPLAALQSGDAQGSSSISDQQLQILQWLLLQLQIKRGYSLSLVTHQQLMDELHAAGCFLPDLPQNLHSCRCIVRLDQNPQQQQQQQPLPGSCLAAYHGTDFSNIHSILHNGLLAASGTRLQTTGAVFGCGVYLSSDFNVAYSFAKGREGWASSCIGKHLRCVLLCQAAKDAAVQGTGAAVAGASSLPEKYILVPKPADVVIRYLLVFSDDALLGHPTAGAGRHRHSGAAVCLYLTVAYAAVMTLLALWQTLNSW